VWTPCTGHFPIDAFRCSRATGFKKKGRRPKTSRKLSQSGAASPLTPGNLGLRWLNVELIPHLEDGDW